MRVIIGDIHGCYDELMDLLDRIGIGEGDEIISVGDLVDRGPKSPKVVTFFMRRPNTRSIMGNHERKHIRYNASLLAEQNFSRSQRKTTWQFSNRDAALNLATYREALDCFKTLPLFIEFPEALIVHAGLVYGVPMESQDERVLTGAGFRHENAHSHDGLFNWCKTYPRDEKPVIFGRLGVGKAPWPLPQRENLWPIDTGCAGGGYLTAVTLPDFRVYQVPSRQKQKNQRR